MPKIEELKNYLRDRSGGGIALAFSGGADSSLLLSVLKELHDELPFPLLALTMHSIFQRDEEIDEVKRLAVEYGVELKIFGCDPLAIPEIKYNPPERCYWCKLYIFNEFLDCAHNHGLAMLIDGTNADDLTVCRPGRKALTEIGVVSPLAELGITKQEIRAMTKERNLRCSDNPSKPCMATRFEYGALLTEDRIELVGKGEDLIRKYCPENADVRLRVHADIARIEVSENVMAQVLTCRKEIAAGLRCLGFEFITLDLEGFRSGCFDQTTNTTMEV